ncbi:uncharacterized protein [Palaemon carinicauda]|uniref:uncharacterized protein n=1 Tax=Palaemon carinicauda TaxID=392227 RepID=UPI0035B59AEB
MDQEEQNAKGADGEQNPETIRRSEFDTKQSDEIPGAQPETRNARSLPQRGQEAYIERRNKFCQQLEDLWSEIQPQLEEVRTPPNDVQLLLEAQEKLLQSYTKHQRLVDEYGAFLKGMKTLESIKDLNACTSLTEVRSTKVNLVITLLHDHFRNLTQAQYTKSRSSKSIRTSESGCSRGSDLSSLARRKRAKAEAARVKIAYAEKQAMIFKQEAMLEEQVTLRKLEIEQEAAHADREKAELKATLNLLEIQREAAAAEAEACVLECDNSQAVSHLPEETEDPLQRVQNFVKNHPGPVEFPEPANQQDKTQTPVTAQLNYNAPVFIPTVNQSLLPVVHSVLPIDSALPESTTAPVPRPTTFSQKQDSIPEFLATNTMANVPVANVNYSQDTSTTSEITKFLLRKDLLFSRLTNFNDRAESYHVWKGSFKCVIGELQVSDSEQLDLLVKWLGAESSKHAISIRLSNADNPSRGLQRLWQRLDERYGTPEMVEASIKNKLAQFPKLTNKENKRLYELPDILSEIEYYKENPKLRCLLAYFDSSSGIKPIVSKLPYGLQEKWVMRASRYKSQHDVAFPPFKEFTSFIREMSRIKNDPGLDLESNVTSSAKGTLPRSVPQFNTKINVRKTAVDQKPESSREEKNVCILHKTKHLLNECRGFRMKSIEERKKLLKENNVCYKCCESTTHISRNCNAKISCKECGSKQHATALHVTGGKLSKDIPQAAHGGEHAEMAETKTTSINSSCTEICKDYYGGKSCAKILPVKVFHKDSPDKDKPENYTLSTCSGRVVTSGRRGRSFVIESIQGDTRLDLPTLIECDHIPNNRDEIPTPEVAIHYPHLMDIRDNIPPIDDNCQILLLIGRDLIEAHHVIDQRFGSQRAPYAQQLKLGWVIIGETCINKQHIPIELNIKLINILPNGQPSMFEPCINNFDIKENYSDPIKQDTHSSIFEKTKNDDKPAMSYEDKMFLKQMDNEFVRDASGSWVAPLPFRVPRQSLPNNRQQALQRAMLLDASLRRNPVKQEHFLTFMSKIFDNNHAELAPPLKDHEECWYLPLFGVYHPKKPDQIRGVFDSSAKCHGVSLNSVLLTGPNLTNNLLGVLIRFRKEMVAVTADIQHMFHCFLVREDHRNYLRFLWHKDNDIDNDLVEYRMRVHVFGNSTSPAVATLGLRKTAQASGKDFGNRVTQFVSRNFYVDDGLTSCTTKEEAINLIKDTQKALAMYGNLMLHKIASNSEEVMKAFPANDLASNLKDLDLEADSKPLQNSLGLSWDVNTDEFLFQLSSENKPITRRGILSTVNSIYDPLGFLAPIIIHGKLLLRKLVSETVDWDQPLSDETATEWISWRNTLQELEKLRIPRTYVPYLSETVSKELHVFSDASEKAIAAVAYLRTTDISGIPSLGFVLGKAKVAPTGGHTIPRLELCAAMLAIEIAQYITDNLDISIETVKYHTDSKVVLGYINNETRRFYTYVANRPVELRANAHNPADSATRSFEAHEIHNSEWLFGPKHLTLQRKEASETKFQLVDPDSDKEVRINVDIKKTCATLAHNIGIDRFLHFSTWDSLVRGVAFLKRFCRSHEAVETPSLTSVDSYINAENFIIRSVQSEVYRVEMDCLQQNEPVPKCSQIANLNPFLDEQGILRVGGRIVNSDLSLKEKKPIIVPGRHHTAMLLVRHYHGKVRHQGRHFTDGAVRSAGLWIVGGKRLISSFIHKCVTCRKLKRKTECQIMSDLPEDRLEPSPPFTNVRVDAFGPWRIVSRRTRGGYANSKRWAILFSCLVTRAVHIELIEEMSSSAFINALRRFISLRGQVKIFRSDRGTNFIGAVDKLRIDSINVEDGPFRKFLYNSGTTWIFNPSHSSHMGGAWERMIGITRRILDSMLLNHTGKSLTHDVLNTFLTEVSAIINSRPLVPVSTDPENPLILTPTMLLTQKTDYIFTSDQLGDFNERDLHLVEWKRVQALASIFWSRWRKEYLPLLQQRQKWIEHRRDLVKGDVVLLKDKNLCRTQWPMGVIMNPLKSSDDHVRKAEVRTIVNGKPTIYTRPIVDMILLVENCL